MKKQKIAISALALAISMIVTYPMDVRAAYDEIKVYSVKTGEKCHCGSIRNVDIYSRTDTIYCNEHGPNCKKLKAMYFQYYYYCTNPYCGDNYYGDWELVDTWHEE